ncbi:MAG: sulfotransferase [Sphingomicrobium sp.]
MVADEAFQQAVDAFQRGDLDRARTLTRQQLTAAPDARVKHLMGLIECRSGRLEAGIDWLGQACAAEPDVIAYRVMLARALTESGRAGEALRAAPPPAGSSPPELALWHARAEAATAIGAWPEAAEAWAKLCESGTADWRSWSAYGHALASLARWGAAASVFRAAAGLNPAEPELLRQLATALARAGRYQDSADTLLQWIELRPNDVAARIMLARLLADLGRQKDSDAQLEKAAEEATGAPGTDSKGLIAIAMRSGVAGGIDEPILGELAQLLERTNRLDSLRTLLEDAEAHGIGRERLGYPAAAIALRDGDPGEARRLLLATPADREPTRRHWLMARVADAMGDADTAFAEAERMNRSVADHDLWRGRARDYLKWVSGLSAMLTSEWAKELKTLRPPDRRSPAFLVGFPRSGTTLLDTFLMGHPKAAVLEEVPLMHQVETVLGPIAGLPRSGRAQLDQARQAYFAELDRHLEPGFDGLAVDKMPLNLIAMPYVHCLFPGARVVFAQRHPCDAVLSCFMQGFALNNAMACFLDIRDAAEAYDSIMTLWVRSRELLALEVHTLVYERLVEAPETELRPVVEFLGLEWTDQLLDHRSTARERGAIGTPSYDQVMQPLSKAAAGRWKRYERQLEPVLPLLLPWAERLGYAV